MTLEMPERLKGLLKSGVLLVLALGAGPPAPLGQEAPLEVLVENAADPFSRKDGTGYANDVVRAAFAAAETPIILTVVPYVRCKSQVLDGSAALCFSMSWLKEFEGRVKFADVPLFTVSPVYFENAAHPLVARSEEQLGAGVRVGTVRGFEYPESTLRARERGAIFVDGASTAANLKKLAAGRLDAVIALESSLTAAGFWIAEAGVQSLVRPAFKSPSQEVAYLGASLRHPRGILGLDRFNRGMAIIKARGTFDSIRNQWRLLNELAFPMRPS